MNTQIATSRTLARQEGLKLYFGKVCPSGHPPIRTTHNSACLTCVKHAQKQWRKRNSEHVRTYSAQWYLENRSDLLAKHKTWRQANPKASARYEAKRKAQLLKATPAWANHATIRKIYDECPPGYHVDHIEPLQAKDRCGLHVEANLQYLPALENLRKGNRAQENAS